MLAVRFLYSLGGIHRGAAMYAYGWLCFQMYILAFRAEWIPLYYTTALLGEFTLIILLALSPLREKYHNWFERSHRFIGWSKID